MLIMIMMILMMLIVIAIFVLFLPLIVTCAVAVVVSEKRKNHLPWDLTNKKIDGKTKIGGV